jgi:RNA polymerase sigma-70 factor (ECF subfamily)
LARKLDSSVDNVDAYLFTVARNALARYLKGSDRRAGSSDELTLALVADESPSQDRELIGKIRLGAALDVIKAMPDRRRNIFVLHRFEEMTYNEIARHMGISVSAVEKHIMAALRALHGCLKAVP